MNYELLQDAPYSLTMFFSFYHAITTGKEGTASSAAVANTETVSIIDIYAGRSNCMKFDQNL